MKAVLLNKHGGPEILEYGDFPTPEPGPKEALVRLKAMALNGLDLWVLEGWPGFKIEYPHIIGADGAGEIAALGPQVSDWKLGDRVVINPNFSCGKCEFCLAGKDNQCQYWALLGEHRRGTFAEFVLVPTQNLYAIPDGFDERVAAAASMAYHTAWHSLITRGGLQAGEQVLVVGASGGVNTASIDIAKFAGATVYVVGSNSDKLTVAESIGADHLIDRSKEENWSKTVYYLTGKRGVDVVVDNVGKSFPLSFRAVRKGGRILTVGNSGGPKVEIDNRYIFGKHLSLIGSTTGTRNEYKTVMDLLYEGKFTPILDRTYPLSKAAEAEKRLQHGEQMGKITLVPE
jgi:NADPH:quinone reductase-like Zn-dependent oxidoreductase